jgi:hypothetical protein
MAHFPGLTPWPYGAHSLAGGTDGTARTRRTERTPPPSHVYATAPWQNPGRAAAHGRLAGRKEVTLTALLNLEPG